MTYATLGLDDDLAAALHRTLAPTGAVRVEDPRLAADLVIGVREVHGFAPISSWKDDDWMGLIDGLRSAVIALRDHTARRAQQPTPGRVVIVVRPAHLRPFAGAAGHAIAGAFLTTVAEAMAIELAPRITVNCVVAGWRTPDSPDFAHSTPLGRLVALEEVAEACAFLLDEARSSFVTGTTVVVDGGWRITRAPGAAPREGNRPFPSGPEGSTMGTDATIGKEAINHGQ